MNRLAVDGHRTIKQEMAQEKAAGLHHVRLRDQQDREITACLEVKYRRLTVLPPIGKQKKYPAQILTVIHAQEQQFPDDRERIEWKLITNLPVDTLDDAVEKLNWYSMRWKIEIFHKILKSGCRAEESKLRTAERLTNLLSIYCILGWRVFWLTMLNRTAPDAPADLAITAQESRLLEKIVPDKKQADSPCSLGRMLFKLAKLGGYMGRTGDGPPGNTVIWRGLRRLTDIQLGYELARGKCG